MPSELHIRRLIRSIILEQDAPQQQAFDPSNPHLARTRDGKIVNITDYAALTKAIQGLEGVKLSGEFLNKMRGVSDEALQDLISDDNRPFNDPPDEVRVTTGFDSNRKADDGTDDPHLGIDYAAHDIMFKSVVAVLDGKIAGIKNEPAGYGLYVDVDHGDNVVTRYAHLDSTTGLKAGDQVDKGTVIGYVGESGNAKGPHLHFELRINNSPNNPESSQQLEDAVFPVKMQ